MLAKIRQAISEKSYTAEDLLVAVNREIVPVLRKVRDAINMAVGDETPEELVYISFRPAATSTSFSAVDTVLSVANSFTYVAADYADTIDDRNLAFYVRFFGGMSAATSSAVTFRLFDQTSGALVVGTEFTTARVGVEDSGLLGPMELDDGHVYVVEALRLDGTADAVLASARLLVRYE